MTAQNQRGVQVNAMHTQYTASGVRMRRHTQGAGPLNWLLLPGGPGLGSESLEGLAEVLDVPGTIWLVDLPGDGSNVVPGDPFVKWPHVLVEAAEALPDAVYLGHSTGGMYVLTCPELRGRVRGIALVDSAPNSDWQAVYVQMTRENPLPAVDAALEVYSADQSQANLATLCVASADWNFTPAGVDSGRALLAALPYNVAAVDWSDRNFDHTYRAAWWPDVPVLRLAGANDRVVAQSDWDRPEYQTPNALHWVVPGAGHFPWIENPQNVSEAFRQFARAL